MESVEIGEMRDGVRSFTVRFKPKTEGTIHQVEEGGYPQAEQAIFSLGVVLKGTCNFKKKSVSLDELNVAHSSVSGKITEVEICPNRDVTIYLKKGWIPLWKTVPFEKIQKTFHAIRWR